MSVRTLTRRRDAMLLSRFGDPLRWVKTDDTEVDLVGVIDLKVEMRRIDNGAGYFGKTVTVLSSVVTAYRQGEQLLALDADGNPTGTTYDLGDTLADDGNLKTIEVTT